MKKDLYSFIDSTSDSIIALGDNLFSNPELGFKENKTREIIVEYLKNYNLSITNDYGKAGFSVSIGSGKPDIGIICELDGVPTINHPFANKDDNAAHSCGHNTQIAATLSALSALNTLKNISGTITLYFCAGEEFTDMAYRKQLIKDNVITYPSGKQELLYRKAFVSDLYIHLHSMSETPYHFSLNSTLAGFIYKKITFKGVGAHAAMAPYAGKNALNMANLFINAINMLRETFKEEDLVRVHGFISKGGSTVNSIPEEVIYECYVRSDNPEYLLKLNNTLTNSAIHCAKALEGDAVVEDTPGYLPLVQSKQLNDIIHKNMNEFVSDDQIYFNEKSIAAGDVGDLSMFKPVIQFGYSGISGYLHSASMAITDKNRAYIEPAKIVVGTVIDLLQDNSLVENIINNFKPKMSYEEYIKYLNNK